MLEVPGGSYKIGTDHQIIPAEMQAHHHQRHQVRSTNQERREKPLIEPIGCWRCQEAPTRLAQTIKSSQRTEKALQNWSSYLPFFSMCMRSPMLSSISSWKKHNI